MPPRTDCSAATSCGGCRSYSGAVACGLLYSSATATDRPPSPRARRPRALTGGKFREGGGGHRLESGFELKLGPGTDNSGPTAARGARYEPRRGRVQHPCARLSAQLVDKSVDTGESTCGDGGGRPGDTGPFSRGDLRGNSPPAVDGRKST